MGWVMFRGLSRFCLNSFRTQVRAKREAELCHTLICSMWLLSWKNNSPPSSASTEILKCFLYVSHQTFIIYLSKSWADRELLQRDIPRRWRLAEVHFKTRGFCFICRIWLSFFISRAGEESRRWKCVGSSWKPQIFACSCRRGQFKSCLIKRRQIPCGHLPTPKLWPY